jgi:Mg-chelatase subunit ChlD
MDRAFDRAKTLLRQPVAYTLQATTRFEVAPGPGLLSVVSKEKGKTEGAVELILDASGSMLKRLHGKRRINIAKEVLTQAVTEIIPVGTPLALRVFGHKKANACQTDLEIKLKPLNPAAAKKTISRINAKNLAKTPIADSLAKVEADLRNVKGKKIVILVTDGEETCEGNPEQVLKNLTDKGFDIRLNIVGFSIDNAELKRQFERWAEQGGGRYFDASDKASLHQSVSDALKTPFTVYDQGGAAVAEGVIGGEPVSLEAGFYQLKISGKVPQGFEGIEIVGEKETKLQY